MKIFMKTAALSSAIALVLAACGDKSETANAVLPTNTAAASGPQSPETKPPMPADADISALPSGTYIMDKTHGYVTFSYWHQGFSKPILRFDDVDATLTLDNENPAASSVNVTIDSASINTGVDSFDSHISGPDMFNVTKFPAITFKSSKLVQATPTTGTLTGNLTMKGITKPVTLDVVFNKAGKHFRTGNPIGGFSATGQLMRSEWDLGYGTPAVGDAVDLRIEAEFGLSGDTE